MKKQSLLYWLLFFLPCFAYSQNTLILTASNASTGLNYRTTAPIIGGGVLSFNGTNAATLTGTNIIGYDPRLTGTGTLAIAGAGGTAAVTSGTIAQSGTSATSGTAGYAYQSGTAAFSTSSGTGGFTIYTGASSATLTVSGTGNSAIVLGPGGTGLLQTINSGVTGLIFTSAGGSSATLSGSSVPYAAVSGSAGYATTSGSAVTSGTTSGLAPNVQPDAWRVNGIVYISSTGNDATGVRNDVGHPFLTGTAAYAVAQNYDVIQTGTGVWGASGFPAWFSTTVEKPLWFRGSGSGVIASDYSQIIGGTRISGPWLRYSGTSYISGMRISNLALDNGTSLTGTNSSNGFVMDSCNDFWISDIKCLGNNTTPDEELAVVSGGSNGVIENITLAHAGQALVIKSSNVQIRGVVGLYNTAETIVFKDGGRLGVGQVNNLCNHCTIGYVNITGSGSSAGDIWVDEIITSNTTPTVGTLTMTNIHTSQGILLTNSGTLSTLNGIEVSNWINDNTLSGGALALNESQTAGALPIYAAFTNCEAEKSKYFVAQPMTFTNCRWNAVDVAVELAMPVVDLYADFIGCTAYNCGTIVQGDTAGPYLLRHPILITGTYASRFNPNVGGATLITLPVLFHGTPNTFATVANTASQTNLWGQSPKLPAVCWQQNLKFRSAGTYTTTGTNSITFVPVIAGSAPNSNNSVVVALTGTSGTWMIEREFWDRDRYGAHGTAYGSWWTKLWINNQFYGNYAPYYPITSGTDQTYDEQAQWSVASPSNSIQTITATIEASNDPVEGY